MTWKHITSKKVLGLAKKKRKFKINEDTMTTIVVSSLLFCFIIIIAGFVFIWFGKDPNSVVASGLDVFGKELGICGVMTIFQRWVTNRDRRKEKEDVVND